MCFVVEGRAYVGGAVRYVSLLVEGGAIKSLKGRGEGCRVLQFSAKHLILPGFVDVHVHFRDWGLSHKETLLGGSAAALAGGVTAVLDMPNTRPHIRTAELYAKRLAEGSALPIHYGVHMGVPEDLAELDAARPRSVKIYPEDVERFGWAHVERLLERCRSLGCVAVFHCEDPAYLAEGSRPPEAEARCADRVALYARRGYRIHVTHVSLPYTVEALRGLATVDATPHHLLLSSDKCSGPLCRVNPPLRGEDQRRRLLALFLAGAVDMYATDHAPHTLEEKLSGSPGICSLDVASSLLLRFWRDGLLGLDDVVRLYSFRPARFAGLDVGLRPGAPAAFSVFKLEEFAVSERDFKGTCRFSPLVGLRAFGRAVAVASKGVLRLLETGEAVA
ncbi:amidohydrolase family protein [Thermoproteus uzoniensis]|nr:amidohydrolase family protein [Thermoproteus uzoniensis]